MKGSQAVLVLCTAPDEDTARVLAHTALTTKLAACVTLLPATSLYVWQEKLVDTREVQLLLKSDNTHQQDLIDLLKASHPYVTPELLVIPVTYGESSYLSWLTASLR